VCSRFDPARPYVLNKQSDSPSDCKLTLACSTNKHVSQSFFQGCGSSRATSLIHVGLRAQRLLHLRDLMRGSVRRRRVILTKAEAFHGPARVSRRLSCERHRPACRASASSSDWTWRSPGIARQHGSRDLPPGHGPAWPLPRALPPFLFGRLLRVGPKNPRRLLGMSAEPAFAAFFPLRERPSIRALAVGLASHHPGRSTLPREPFSLRRASGVSLEYLLLSPRSAPARVPARECPEPSLHLLSFEKKARRDCLLTLPPERAARHRQPAKRPPFSRLLHSASQLLRTA